jgi:hypothetical protein
MNAERGNMATKRPAMCQLDVDFDVQDDILACGDEACDAIGAFLEELQEDPLPEERQKTKSGFFYSKLPCGYYVAWEVLGDVFRLETTGSLEGIVVRILGVGRKVPEGR